MMAFFEKEFPLDIKISFSSFFDQYKELAKSKSILTKERAAHLLELQKNYPELEEGITSMKKVEALSSQIQDILEDSFARILQKNEIKIATIPFSNKIIKATERYQKIIDDAGKNFEPEIINLNQNHHYIMGCSMILNKYYNYSINFRRPFFYDIPDATGIERHYRIMYNADFVKILKTDKAKDITKEDIDELLDNFDNIAIWKDKFPPKSWIFKGIIIANLFDVTTDVSLSNLKTGLLKYDKTQDDLIYNFGDIFQAIFNLPRIKVGFSIYNQQEGTLEKIPFKNIGSYVLKGDNSENCSTILCSESYQRLLKGSTYSAISDVLRSHQKMPNEKLFNNLLDQNIHSAILAPIIGNNEFLGVLELVSPNTHDLNSINAHKLEDIMPYLVDSVMRSKSKAENNIELIIQEECTSIHHSVYWKFREEAKKVLMARSTGIPASFGDIVFKNVYPLFGQIDIKGSSEIRNETIQKDIVTQLKAITKVINKVKETEDLPIYTQLQFRIEKYMADVNQQLEVDTEKKILDFIKKEVNPFFKHIKDRNAEISKLIDDYDSILDRNMKMVYKFRKDYDESVMLINKEMAQILDHKQRDAQAMYPHFYERFKTDGVEHNIYIGESITKKDNFHKMYLYNLRLWQLQVMCEMENEFYQLQKKLPCPLEVTSMVLVFNSSLSVRFRMDEKRFDVDGTYNARYEVIKKRVDKAFIKGTKQRITENGKLVIVYSQRADEREYVRYINFLQSKKYLEEEIEIVELEDLQSITGLRALRVNILYHQNKKDKEYYTYDDLMKEIHEHK